MKTEIIIYSNCGQFMERLRFPRVSDALAEAKRKCAYFGMWVAKTPSRVIFSENATDDIKELEA